MPRGLRSGTGAGAGGVEVALARPTPPRWGGQADGPGTFLHFHSRKALDIPPRVPYLPPPAAMPAGADLSSEQIPKTSRDTSSSRPPPGRPRKKDLDFGDSLRETGNPPLDGTGSLKTEQRRTREGRRKSSSRGDLRDSFEGLVRRDEPGSTSRWLVGLHQNAFLHEALGPSVETSFKLFLESLILAQSERWRQA